MPDLDQPIGAPATGLPINVSASPLVPIVAAVLRHVLTLAGGILVTKGLLDQSAANQAVDAVLGIILAAAPGIWAAVRAKLTHDKLVTVAEAAPDRVATVS